MPRDKKTLTQQLVELLPPNHELALSEAMSLWWFNLRKNGGMRLTAAGYHVFVTVLELEHYAYEITDPLSFNQQTILDLDRKMQMPYYIHATKGIPKKIVLFGSREAVMLNLYGNLRKFLDNYSL